MKKKWLRKHYRGLPRSAQLVLMSDHLRESETALRGAILRNPRVYALASTLADLLTKQGRRREGLVIWRQSVGRFGRKPNPYFQRAHWAMTARNFSEAEKFLRLCLQRDRGYFRETAHFWRAEALARLGRTQAALRELTYVPDDYEELWFLGHRRWSKSDLLAKLTSEATNEV